MHTKTVHSHQEQLQEQGFRTFSLEKLVIPNSVGATSHSLEGRWIILLTLLFTETTFTTATMANAFHKFSLPLIKGNDGETAYAVRCYATMENIYYANVAEKCHNTLCWFSHYYFCLLSYSLVWKLKSCARVTCVRRYIHFPMLHFLKSDVTIKMLNFTVILPWEDWVKCGKW